MNYLKKMLRLNDSFDYKTKKLVQKQVLLQ